MEKENRPYRRGCPTGLVTAQADTGQYRYVAQDRYFVFLVDATSSYSTIAAGMHAFVFPRALYMESQLKVRIEGGTTWPLGSTEFFAEDVAWAEISEVVTAVTAGSLKGSQVYWLLQSLLQNTTGDVVHEAVDVTTYVPLLNLPTDALQILPWAGVTNCPTGTMPQDVWDRLGSLANSIVSGLLTVGQLIDGGLIALGTFYVALGEAIVVWGMGRIDTYVPALVQGWETAPRAGEIPDALLIKLRPGVSHSESTRRTCRLHGPGDSGGVASDSWVSYVESPSRDASSSSITTVSVGSPRFIRAAWDRILS